MTSDGLCTENLKDGQFRARQFVLYLQYVHFLKTNDLLLRCTMFAVQCRAWCSSRMEEQQECDGLLTEVVGSELLRAFKPCDFFTLNFDETLREVGFLTVLASATIAGDINIASSFVASKTRPLAKEEPRG